MRPRSNSPQEVHLDEPGPDTGVFSTEEVRPRNKPKRITSRVIAFPRNHYKTAPNVAAGFKLLELSHEADIRANLVGDRITASSFKITLETWPDSILYRASAQWIEHKAGARECHFGQFDTQDVAVQSADGVAATAQQEYSRRIKFRLSFDEPPAVICWLNRIDMASGEGRNWRIDAHATDVTAASFVARLDAWGDTLLNGAAMCWIAFPRSKKRVASGRFSTMDVRPWNDPRPRNSKRIEFPPGTFERPPTVLVALNMLDMAGNADLRIRADAEDVDAKGFTCRLDTWEDSTLYAASASWIALGFS